MDNKKPTQRHDLDDVSLENATAEADIVRPGVLQGVTANEDWTIGMNTTLKLDLMIMPAMVIFYILNYLGRQIIAAARLANLVGDLNMSTQQYNAAVSILFVGYRKLSPRTTVLIPTNKAAVIMQVHSNLIVSSTRWPALYMCGAVAVWGVISACTAAVRSYGGLLACRFLLGFVEAVSLPGAFFYLSSFYNQR